MNRDTWADDVCCHRRAPSTWQKYGEWQYKLLDGRDELTEPFRNKLHGLTAHCSTDREKRKERNKSVETILRNRDRTVLSVSAAVSKR